MVLSETAVLPLCPWGGGSLAATPVPTWMTRKAPTTIAAITSRLRMPASVFIGGAVATAPRSTRMRSPDLRTANTTAESRIT